MKLNLPQMALVVICILMSSNLMVRGQEYEDQPARGILSLAWSPDSSMIAIGRPQGIEIVDAISGESIKNLLGSPNGVISVDWSPDGSKLAGTTIATFGVRVWDVASGRIIMTIQEGGQGVITVRWHPDGTRLAVTASSNGIGILDADTGELIGFPPILGTFISWSPDGTKLVSASGYENEVYVADIVNNQQLMTLYGHTAALTTVAWSPDGMRIASGSADNTSRVWDAEIGEALLILEGHTDLVTEVVWSPDSSKLASASSDSTVRIWDADTGEQVELFEYIGQVRTVDWSSDGSHIAYAGYRSDGVDANTVIVELSPLLRATATPAD